MINRRVLFSHPIYLTQGDLQSEDINLTRPNMIPLPHATDSEEGKGRVAK
jgi:hypothetical protein